MNFMTNYLIDYGRRDLYYGTVPGTHMGIMALGPAHGLDDDYALLLSKATAQMLNTESEAGYANKAFTLAHRQVIANEDETVYKLDGLAELSRPLIELTALAFRNCAFTLMGGTPKPDSIKAYEPPLYDLLVAKLEIIKDPYMIRNLITKETFIEVRDVPKFPPPAPNL
jgi:hypothetical protein